jgi:hypothetical protein
MDLATQGVLAGLARPKYFEACHSPPAALSSGLFGSRAISIAQLIMIADKVGDRLFMEYAPRWAAELPTQSSSLGVRQK